MSITGHATVCNQHPIDLESDTDMSEGPREIFPVSFGIGGATRNFGPEIIRTESEENLEPAPKDASVPVSVISSVHMTPQTKLATNVPTAESPLAALDEAADRESGKLSESTEVESPTQKTIPLSPESSSPSSSSEANPGWQPPPAQVVPPTSG